jgi:hypothetical protein
MLAVPQFASRILRSAEQSQTDVLAKVSKDLALIYSGQEVGAQPNGGAVAMDYIQNTYIQNPDIQRKLQEDPIFAENLSTYVKQYQFQAQQQENAQTGRLGTPPTDLQGANTIA